MATGYTRNDTSNNIANGNVIDADDLDGEFNAVQSAFDASTGHNHDGTTGGGAPVTVVGPVQDVVVSASSMAPKTDSAYELGTTSVRWSTGYLDSLVLTNALPVAQGGTGSTTESAARTALGLEIGTDVQAYDAGLQSIAGLTTASDKMVYTTASDTYAVTDLTSFARTILDDADAATVRTTLGLGTGATATIADYVPIAGNVTLTGGFDSDEEALGTISSGTVTPEVDSSGKENFKTLTNNGAFTLAPPSTSSATTIRIRVINGASAGAITTSGFDKVNDPDNYTTTNAKEYWFYIDHDSARSTLTISEIV